MSLFSLREIEQAAQFVHKKIQPTPQLNWPQISEMIGANVWVKHENHTPTGSFKIRGAITFIDWLKSAHPDIKGIITATRGNHGQGQAREATAAGLKAKIIVPLGNSKEKNDAMRSFGGELIEYGNDFDEARVKAVFLSKQEGLYMVPAYHSELVRGVSTYAFELFSALSDLDSVYVPIGCGSGACGLVTVRDALNIKTKIIGVVSEQAQAVKLSFDKKNIMETSSANTFADGLAVRVPVAEAFDIYSKGIERVVSVSENDIANAIRVFYQCTHNMAEGAGAAALAALLKDKHKMQGKNVGVILSGSNIDAGLFCQVLKNEMPPFI